MDRIKQQLQQASSDGVVIGLGVTGNVVPRLDIDQLLLREPLTFNLFLLALARLQTQPDKMGYFQIAGIHGLPASNWDGIDGPGQGVQGLNDGGYCTHGLLTFPTWHRPYVAMLEQSIYKTMLDVVDANFPNSTNYRNAVAKFRLPYWDPYRPRGGRTVFPGAGGTTSFPYDFKLPQIMTLELVMVLSKETDQQLTPIRNPLQRFTYPQTGSIPRQQWSWVQAAYEGAYFDRWTTRHPNPNNSSNSAGVNQDLNRAREQMVRSMVNCLTSSGYKQWRAFSNHGMTPPTDSIERGSLEGFHDQYHGLIGGQDGHMSIPPVAAFDPVFWLHHCNVDRLFAIWQAINPNVWWPNTLRRGEPKSDVALTPFRTPTGDSQFWTSDNSRDTRQFGYTYNETGLVNPNAIAQDIGRRYNWSQQQFIPAGGQATAPADMQDAMNTSSAPFFQFNSSSVPAALAPTASRITSMANSASTMATGAVENVTMMATSVKQNVLASAGPTEPAGEKAKPVASAPSTANNGVSPKAESGNNVLAAGVGTASGTQKPLVLKIDQSGIPQGATRIRQWYIDSEVNRMALNGTFTIHFFIGDPSPSTLQPSEYAAAPSLAGSAHFFIAPSQACDNCNRLGEAGVKVSNTTAITPILGDYIRLGQLDSLEPEHVVPFLVKKLQWRVVKAPGPDATNREQQPIATRDIDGFKLYVNSDLSYLEPGHFLAVEVGSEVFDDEVIEAIENGDGA